MPFSFRNDQPEAAVEVLREVGQWLTDNQQELWQVDTLTLANLLDEYTTDNLFIMYSQQENDPAPVPAAVFILQWEDPLYWPDVPPNTSGFVHKLAIRRQFAGQNLFAAMLDFCRSECKKRDIIPYNWKPMRPAPN